MSDYANDFPELPKPKRHRQSLRLMVNLILLSVFVLALNYISCSRYERKDLTEDQRYTLSQQTLRLLSSQQIKERSTPVKITFAFPRNTENYTRMRSLLEDYVKYSGDNVSLECVDPLRSPNRARDLSNIYGIEFSQPLVIVDARPDTGKSLFQTDDERNQAAHVRFLPGSKFVKYDLISGKIPKAVALQMEDIVTSGLIGALEGKPHNMYLIVDKSRLGRENKQDPTTLFATIDKLAREQNLQLIPTRISEVPEIPRNAAGVILIGPQYDLLPGEMEILQNYWDKTPVQASTDDKDPSHKADAIKADSNENPASMFIMLDASAGPLPNLFRFLREHGIRPRNDRIMKAGSTRAIYETTAIFTPGPEFTKDFWNSSTMLEGQSNSLKVDEGEEYLAQMRINPIPLLAASSGYYGETKYDSPNPKFDPKEDYAEDLAVAAAVEQGSNDLTMAYKTRRMTVISNMDMLNPQKVRPDQRDFLKACLFWITDRESLAGIGTRMDSTIKIDWDEETKSIIELCVTILLPILALLIAFFLWRSRRS